MAVYPELTSGAVALTATVVATYTVPSGSNRITVFNRAGTDEVFITVNGTTPTVAGANEYYLPKVIGASVVIPIFSGGDAVEFISASSQSIWVEL